jgi:signal transduction histidine kinase
MRLLPPFVVGPRRWYLPIADASAVALAGLLLADDPGVSAWAEVLSADPSLALWVALEADRAGADPPAGITDLARWFAEHALQILRWEPALPAAAATGRSPLGDASREMAQGARVAKAVAGAELAGQLAAAEGAGGGDRAALLALLDDAAAWMADAEAVPSAEPPYLPAWLLDARPFGDGLPPFGDGLRPLGAGLLTPPCSASESVPAGRPLDSQRGEEARQRWLAAIEPAAGWLPALAERLSRLARLEHRFDEALQTEKLEAMAEFAAGAGHEINNPLAVIAGRAQLFLRQESDPQRRRALALISAQAMRIYEMIADMRLFARPPRLEPARVELVALVDRLLGELQPWAEGQETALARSGGPEPVEIQADPVQLTVALRAVVQNALEALGHGGHVELCVRRVEKEVEISVADDGPGIPTAQRQHLFGPFYSARQAGRGLGMGLAKCWRIVTNHGGRIEVQSTPGRGATFSIHLPADGPRQP